MDLSFLPKKYLIGLGKVDLDKLSEIRLRVGFPVIISYNFKKSYLSIDGATLFGDKAILCQSEDVNFIINTVTEFSLYAHNDRIREGYLVTKSGLRIGLAGECVYDGEKILTIKNFSSLNIRIPNEVFGCSEGIFKYVINDYTVYNTLIISPPFMGKTTILKDLARNIDAKLSIHVLILDERGEFENVVGENIDKIKFSTKNYGFNYGTRVLSPQVIIVDELMSKNDWTGVLTAKNSGVKVVASCHSDNIENLLRKECFIKGVFDRYVFLGKNDVVGLLDCVLDGEFNRL